MNFNGVCVVVCGALALTICGEGRAATLNPFVNGDFSDGLNGYTATREGFSSVPDNGQTARIQTFNGNPYLELDAFSSLRPQLGVAVTQGFDLNPLAPILNLDIARLSIQRRTDSSVETTSPADNLTVFFRVGDGNLRALFQLSGSGGLVKGSGVDDALLSSEAVTEPIFDTVFPDEAFSLTADLGAFSGEAVELSFFAGRNNDEVITRFGVDNVAFTGVAPIPLPAALPMLLAALAGMVALRRWA